jgi:hypothetical protein
MQESCEELRDMQAFRDQQWWEERLENEQLKEEEWEGYLQTLKNIVIAPARGRLSHPHLPPPK